MAVPLPVLGLSSSLLQPLRTSHRHTPTFSLSNSAALPLTCRIRASRSNSIAEEATGSGRRTIELSALSVTGSLLSAGASLAEEAAVVADPSDVGISTTVSTLFVVATIGLVVLTSGVIYLALSDFLDKRALQEEQKKVAQQQEKPKKSSKQAVKAAARVGGPKGFGSGKRTKSDGEDFDGSN